MTYPAAIRVAAALIGGQPKVLEFPLRTPNDPSVLSMLAPVRPLGKSELAIKQEGKDRGAFLDQLRVAAAR
jgi:hypothetical protein